jgi:hypothetical protein
MEVEELTRKEMIKCLRNKAPFEQGDSQNGKMAKRKRDDRRRYDEPMPNEERTTFEAMGYREPKEQSYREYQPTREYQPPRDFQQREFQYREQRVQQPASEPKVQREVVKELPKEVKEQEKPMLPPVVEIVTPTKENLLKELDELGNTLNARFYNSRYERVADVPVRDVIKKLSEIRDVKTLVFDGIITQRLVDLASKQGVKSVVGIKIGNVNKAPEGIEIITKS